MNAYLLTLVVYSAVLIAVGVATARRRVSSASDFLVGGRKFGPGVIFATFLAANLGAGSTVGASGIGFRLGVSAWWWVGSAGIGTLILSQVVGPRLWRIAKAAELHTMGDYLELRYSRAVRGVIAAILWFGTLAILAGQLMAIAWILNVVAGFPKWAGCIVGGAVAIVYCTAGGLASSAIVNTIELSVTLTGLVGSAFYALHAVGGWNGLTASFAMHMNADAGSAARYTSFIGAGGAQILAWLSILVPSFICSPGLAQKLYGARDEKAVRLGIGLNSLGQFAFAIVPAIFGMIALAAFAELRNPEFALPAVIIKIVPPWLGLWALAAVFSAELSATDAILFMLSTSLAVDLYQSFVNPKVSPRMLLTVGRITTLCAGVAGISLAIALPSVISAVTIFYAILAVALFVPFILGLYWLRMSAAAALASIAAAIAAYLAVYFGTARHTLGIFPPALIGIAAGFAAAIAASIAAPNSKLAPIATRRGMDARIAQ